MQTLTKNWCSWVSKKTSNCRTAGCGNKSIWVFIRSLAPLHLSSASLKRTTVVAIWKLLFHSRQYHPDRGLWLGDLQWALLLCLEAELNGTAALLEMLINEVPKKTSTGTWSDPLPQPVLKNHNLTQSAVQQMLESYCEWGWGMNITWGDTLHTINGPYHLFPLNYTGAIVAVLLSIWLNIYGKYWQKIAFDHLCNHMLYYLCFRVTLLSGKKLVEIAKENVE